MEQILRQKRNANILRFVRSLPCRACGGTRLRPEALAVTFGGRNIAEAAALSIDELRRFFESGKRGPGEATSSVVSMPTGYARRCDERCDALQRLGLGYLTLDRESTTLSAGEAQRVRLARAGGHRAPGRALRARRALGRPAPARHRAAARRAPCGCAIAATPCSSSSTTSRPSAGRLDRRRRARRRADRRRHPLQRAGAGLRRRRVNPARRTPRRAAARGHS